MSRPGRNGLATLIRQTRQRFPSPPASAAVDESGRQVTSIEALEARIAHLEKLVQGLQDSVYRDFQRHDKRIDELQTRTDPAALAVALSKDARNRGL